MKKDRLSFVSGFLPPLCMVFMLAFEYLVDKNMLQSDYIVVAMAEIMPFLIPFLLANGLIKSAGIEAKFARGFSRKAVSFVIFMSLAATLMSFLLGSAVSILLGSQASPTLAYAQNAQNIWMAVLLVILLPAVFEELFFRGSLLLALGAHGTMSALLLSSIMFALLHGNEFNLVGPLAAGMVFGYMAYTLESVWPAVIGHSINNIFYLAMTYVAETYQSLGIWPYFLLISTVLFGFFLYISMKMLGKLIEKGKIRKLQKGGLRGALTGLLFTPGLWLMGLIYIIRIAYT